MKPIPAWSKLPREHKRQVVRVEDWLTGRTFGLLRYLPPGPLAEVVTELGLRLSTTGLQVKLWPWYDATTTGLERGTEPDVALAATHGVCFVEAKHVASKLGDDPTQLGRQWLIATERGADNGAHRLVTITGDRVAPMLKSLDDDGTKVTVARQIQQYCMQLRSTGRLDEVPSLRVIEASVAHVWWGRLAAACRVVAGNVPTHQRRLLEDVAAILGVAGFRPFRGWRFDLATLAPLERPLFLRERA